MIAEEEAILNQAISESLKDHSKSAEQQKGDAMVEGQTTQNKSADQASKSENPEATEKSINQVADSIKADLDDSN